MVPMWTVPIALVMGNTVILKPSEKVPLTMNYTCQLIKEAGFPPAVFQIINGTKDCVEALIDHPDTKAITFVGSSPIAKIVSQRCRSLESPQAQPKRCTALGGAKNHLVALSDCDADTASSDITVSFAGCAGQRCMAASVLLLVEDNDDDDDNNYNKDNKDNDNGNTSRLQVLVNKIIDKSSKIEAGNQPGQMGPVIDEVSYKKIISYIEHSEQNCNATILLDGRSWTNKNNKSHGGNLWIGPTIILHSNKDDKTMSEEVFGPVLSIFRVKTWEDAIEIENKNPFGNAASIYTSIGGNAEWFTSRFRSSMLGINIGYVITFLRLCYVMLCFKLAQLKYSIRKNNTI
jgi:malonate-semialdehyde dehydrogenase (acetylating)/methylmalonate-semialdehyde dehydrogenase